MPATGTRTASRQPRWVVPSKLSAGVVIVAGMRPDQLELITTLGRPTVHQDGSWAVVGTSRPDLASDSYVGQLWRVPLDGHGAPRRLTRGRSDVSPQFSPDGALLGFLRADTNGRPQIWLMPTDGGEAMQVTDQKLGVGQFRFSPDGARMAFVARVAEEGRYATTEGVSGPQEDPRRFTGLQMQANGLGWMRDRRRQVFVVDVPDVFSEPFVKPVGRAAKAEAQVKEEGQAPATGFPTAHQLTHGDHDHADPAFSPDGRWVMFTASRDEDDEFDITVDIHKVSVDGGDPERLWTSQAKLGLGDPTFSGDHLFAAGMDLGPSGMDFVGHNDTIWLLDPEPRQIIDPEDFELAAPLEPDGRGGVLAVVNAVGQQHLFRVNADGIPTPLLICDVVVHSAVAVPGRDAVLAVVADHGSAGELCLVQNGQLTKLTDFSAALREQTRVTEPQELTSTSPDGQPVHGWVWAPQGEGPHPVLLNIHGGPYASYHSAWFDEFQTLVEAGYAVVACNPRGSSGYGQKHGQAIKGDLGNLDMVDVLGFLDHATATVPGLDANRVGIMGGSYGGYLTAWIIGHDHRWAGAIVERGFLDPRSFIGASDIGWFFTGEYNTRDAATMDAQSPMHLTEQVTTPTLVLHSEDDLRCPLSQALRYYTQLKLAGCEAEMLVFPGEDHELSRSGTPWHRRQRLEAILDWWARHLPVNG